MAWGRWWRATEYHRPVDPGLQAGVQGDRREDRRFVLLLLVLTGLVIVFSLLVPGSADAQFAVLVLVLTLIATVAFLLLFRLGVKVPPLASPIVPPRVNEGSLGRLAEALGRANRGMRFSQVVIARRVREAFLTRVAHERGLGRDELESLLAEPRGLQGLVSDPYLQAFLEDTAPAEEQLIKGLGPRGPTSFRFARRTGFTAGIASVLEAIEGWH